ncbi:hypothetical protein BSL78_06467 [Apostichopus japonicus]|uniref:Uncharacterized protein n=1 Tax=Stichopus japonicus TaxID=307972 RepID=A0A2G8L8N2_STIJA|nr:hypothetical protein BSL78_06467 [Apostichopus japonicus]
MLKKSNFIESWGFARVPNAPLFLSTLLYLDVDKSTKGVRPAGHWRMSNIVESIIDCMEHHYMSKLNVEKSDFRQVMKEIGKTLLSVLDKKAPQSVNEWKKLPESDLKGALLMGMLHTNEYSSKDASSSKNSCASLRYPVLRGYFLGHHILHAVNDKKFNKHYIQTNLQNKDFKDALKYICGINSDVDKTHHLKVQVFLTLKKKDMWDDYIDCFYEVQDPKVKKTIVKSMDKNEEITVKQVDCTYHKRNVTHFFNFCKELNYPRGMLIFEGIPDISFFVHLLIPNVQRVVIIRRELQEAEVIPLVRWIARIPKVTLQFHDCAMDTFSRDTIKTLNQATSRLPDNIQIDRSSGGSWKKFNNNETYNFNTGQWETTLQSQQSDFTAYSKS